MDVPKEICYIIQNGLTNCFYTGYWMVCNNSGTKNWSKETVSARILIMILHYIRTHKTGKMHFLIIFYHIFMKTMESYLEKLLKMNEQLFYYLSVRRKGTIQPGLRLQPSGNFFLALNKSHNFLLKKVRIW